MLHFVLFVPSEVFGWCLVDSWLLAFGSSCLAQYWLDPGVTSVWLILTCLVLGCFPLCLVCVHSPVFGVDLAICCLVHPNVFGIGFILVCLGWLCCTWFWIGLTVGLRFMLQGLAVGWLVLGSSSCVLCWVDHNVWNLGDPNVHTAVLLCV